MNDARLRQPECLVAVTGTNGKSSVVHFLRQIWEGAQINCASLGTVGLFIGDRRVSRDEIEIPQLTTPGQSSFREILDFLVSSDVTHLAFEASSHGLVQKRVHEAVLSAAAFTNFGSDHLDYHKTIDSYLDAKLILFKEILERAKPAVVFGDQPEIVEAVRKYNDNIVTFGSGDRNTVNSKNVKVFPEHVVFDLVIDGHVTKDVEVKVFGKLQVLNVLCAVALSYVCGLTGDTVIMALDKLCQLDGRLEMVAAHNGGRVYVDYAHTAQGFQRALEEFREVCKERLICVFGCGGDRDKSKRGLMGKIASSIADIVIVTDDNPRTECPRSIRKEILAGCKADAIEIDNRSNAIKYAVGLIKRGDVLVIVGKGHETTQTYGDKILDQNDKEDVLNVLVRAS
jgi:UDP-N-acetylmuramoyl-L-alanyl-D-glutamate--2,6-diaminopimelate ligase